MKQNKAANFLRWVLTLFLLSMVFFETGIFTTIALGLIAIKHELEALGVWKTGP